MNHQSPSPPPLSCSSTKYIRTPTGPGSGTHLVGKGLSLPHFVSRMGNLLVPSTIVLYTQRQTERIRESQLDDDTDMSIVTMTLTQTTTEVTASDYVPAVI